MKKSRKGEEEDYDYLNEDSTVSLPMVIGGAVLVVVIIVLCVLIWQMLHQEKPVGTSLQNATKAEDTLVNQGFTGKTDKESSSAEKETVQTKVEESSEEAADHHGDTSDEDGEPEEEDAGSSEAGDGEGAAGSEAGENEKPDQSQGVTMTFRDVQETVTAKDATNLRSEPSTLGEDTVVAQLKNGEAAKRTGINETTGWSRLEYKGAVVYASSRLLTTDLTAKPENSQSTTDSNTVTTATGRIITFTPCDDTVSPKMEVNLRNEPSTNQGNDTVHYRMKYGETVHRTGYDDASGWSRVEYDGKVLYVVTSYIYVVEEPGEP